MGSLLLGPAPPCPALPSTHSLGGSWVCWGWALGVLGESLSCVCFPGFVQVASVETKWSMARKCHSSLGCDFRNECWFTELKPTRLQVSQYQRAGGCARGREGGPEGGAGHKTMGPAGPGWGPLLGTCFETMIGS